MAICNKCGTKIPTTYKSPHNGIRKTKKSRKYCFNCSPIVIPPPIHDRKSERRQKKIALIEMLGGKCAKCGYNKSVTALSFHHKVTSEKKFDISNGCLLKSWNALVIEARKCEILCLNCHAELHDNGCDSDNNKNKG